MTTKAAVISDTHGLLSEEVLQHIGDCDVIIHGGDINKPEILQQLQAMAPLYVVRGNNDKEWAEHLPLFLEFQLEECRFFLVHNKKDVPRELGDTDVVIFGHSHKYSEQNIDGRLWLNPGSCGRRRFDLEISFAVVTVEGKNIKVRKVVVDQGAK